MHDVYGVYGISVLAVRGTTLDELAQQVPLVRFADWRSSVSVRSAPPDWTWSRRAATPATTPWCCSTRRRGECLCLCERRMWANPYHEE